MSGKIVGIVLLLCAALAGGFLYYLQIYGYYETVADDGQAVALLATDGSAQALGYAGFEAIDAESSPIRYRACFTTDARPADLALQFQAIEATPRNAPFWFDCFDAEAIAGQLKAGTATAFMGTKNVHFGVDRIVAITEDGRGFVWHDLNDCGQRAYDGTVVGEECPARPATN